MIANVGSGVMMYAVHLLNKKIPPEQYGIFGVLLAVAMFVPNMPLQMVFAQQTAQALATDRRRELAGMIRLAWLGTFGLFLLLALGVFIWQKDILTGWKITNPADLWITVFVVLFSLWLPMFWGVLQGQQNFFWLGWSNILQRRGPAGHRVVPRADAGRLRGGHDAGRVPGAGGGGRRRHLANTIAMAAARTTLRLAQLAEANRSVDAGICRRAVLFHGGHHVRQSLFSPATTRHFT